jgi:hypothetical protein
MIDPIKILQRAWQILWNYRTLWIFGLILALAVGGSSGGNGGNNNGVQWREENQNRTYEPPSYDSPQEFFRDAGREMQKLFKEGIPEADIPGEDIPSFLWTLGGFIAFMFLVGIIVSIAYYVSVTAVIRMVDEYENTGTKLTWREGWRIGWSRTAWRVFLINLIVNLPGLLFFLALLGTGLAFLMAVGNGNMNFNPVLIVILIGLLFLSIFAVVILSFVLSLLRPFFWRVAVLEDAGVNESLRRGWAMARANWKNAGLMWLVMIGLGIVWIPVSIIAVLITLPVILVTGGIAALIAALPGLLLVGLFSTFLAGPLPWIAAGLFVLPLFFVIAFSPWLLLGSWQQVFTSTVWTLTYREIKALPALMAPVIDDLEPVGD